MVLKPKQPPSEVCSDQLCNAGLAATRAGGEEHEVNEKAAVTRDSLESNSKSRGLASPVLKVKLDQPSSVPLNAPWIRPPVLAEELGIDENVDTAEEERSSCNEDNIIGSILLSDVLIVFSNNIKAKGTRKCNQSRKNQ